MFAQCPMDMYYTFLIISYLNIFIYLVNFMHKPPLILYLHYTKPVTKGLKRQNKDAVIISMH